MAPVALLSRYAPPDRVTVSPTEPLLKRLAGSTVKVPLRVRVAVLVRVPRSVSVIPVSELAPLSVHCASESAVTLLKLTNSVASTVDTVPVLAAEPSSSVLVAYLLPMISPSIR
jgi:hypothetical protein